jgi:hypothetical protein
MDMTGMTWPGAVEHGRLLTIAERLLEELASLRQRLAYDNNVAHMQHVDFADRARSLAAYLEAAVLLTRADLYAPAFANLRSALEQVLVDRLVFLGRRYIQVIHGVNETTWTEWERQRTMGEAFTTVVDWKRTRNGIVEITHEGLRSASSDSDSILLSIHYFLIQQYQPYFGPPSAQAQFDDGLGQVDRDREFAKQNEAIYWSYLRWKSIKRSLAVNGFASGSDIHKLEVHYRFLSAFVHPVSDVVDLIYGRNQLSLPVYDHYSSELALLYVIVLAVGELQHFKVASQVKPQVEIKDWAQTEQLCRHAWEQVSYLWFPGHSPHSYDRITEANKRMFRSLVEGSQRQVVDPSTIRDSEVRYYRDPLRRLVSLHSGFHEITTGLVFVSPWPRSDAQLR